MGSPRVLCPDGQARETNAVAKLYTSRTRLSGRPMVTCAKRLRLDQGHGYSRKVSHHGDTARIAVTHPQRTCCWDTSNSSTPNSKAVPLQEAP